MTKPTTARPPDRLQQLLASDPDLVDRIFEYVVDLIPEISGTPARLAEAKSAVRAEFRGERHYIRGDRNTERQALARQVLSLFNGRNATEVARRLRISRATVYRLIKQAGRPAGESA